MTMSPRQVAELMTQVQVPVARAASSQLPVQLLGPTPDELSISGWPSMLIDGAENPTFDSVIVLGSVAILSPPIDSTDAVTKAYVDAKFEPLVLPNLPTSSAGLQPGTLWNNGGFVCVV